MDYERFTLSGGWFRWDDPLLLEDGRSTERFGVAAMHGMAEGGYRLSGISAFAA